MSNSKKIIYLLHLCSIKITKMKLNNSLHRSSNYKYFVKFQLFIENFTQKSTLVPVLQFYMAKPTR